MQRLAPLTAALLLSACQNGGPANASAPTPAASTAPATAAAPDRAFAREEIARFDEPWAMAFLPDGRLLVTEKSGDLKLFDPAAGTTTEIGGVPKVAYGGQGGLGDVALHPRFADNGLVYFSYAEAGDGGTRGAVVARARLDIAAANPRVADVQTIWQQVPKVSGGGHYAHRILFAPDGKLFISSGDRQKFDPAQDMQSNMGKIVRLEDDGRLPADNPFAAQGGVAAQVWTLGHRNPLGIAFDAGGQLWSHEMGPKGGDEFNRVVRGDNYGYPIVSNGDHYDGRPIPDHDTAPQYHAPAITWTPVISPSSMIFYSGAMFPQWQGRALIGGLSSKALVVVEVDGETAREAARHDMGERIRAVAQGPDGAVWLLEDGKNARLLKLTP